MSRYIGFLLFVLGLVLVGCLMLNYAGNLDETIQTHSSELYMEEE